MAHDPLELERNVDVDVLVEAGLDGAEGGQRGPVVAAAGRPRTQLRLAPSQLLSFPL